MRWKLWTCAAVIGVMEMGCPRPNTCPPGEVLVEGGCAVDCPPGSTTGCRDTGVRNDATSEGGDGATCPMGQTRCDGQCVDLSTSAAHCGMCGMRCATPEAGTATCSMGMCSLSCPSNTHACNGACVSNDAITSCGTRCDPCPTPAGSRATCASQACGIECLAGFERVGEACEPLVPRPVFPPGTSTVTSHRPTFRWVLGAATDGAVVEVCRDRACTMRVAMFDATGTSARAPSALPASSALFWRLRGRVGMTAGTRFSPTWQFRTRATDSSVDTAYGTELDINGDGFTDVAAGARATSTLRGSVKFVLGSATGTAATVQTVQSMTSGEFFGETVASVGDVNGDGLGDFVIGAPFADVAGMSRVGCIELYLGRADGLVMSRAARHCGREALDVFGSKVVGGDVNGDGYSDVVVSAPSAEMRAGRIVVFWGVPTGVNDTPSAAMLAGTTSSLLGSSMTGIDVDRDGRMDVVAAVGVDLRLFRGTMGGLVATTSVFSSGRMGADTFGLAVSNAGDLNNDGNADIAVGAPTASVAGRGSAGSVLIWLGNGAELLAGPTVGGAANGDRFGSAVAIVRDMNSDGFDELLVGAPQADPLTMSSAGSAYLFRGAATGAETTSVFTANGASLNDFMGSAVASNGDVNGDGRGDFSVGAPGADPMARNAAGSALLYFGNASPALHRTIDGSADGDALGTSLASGTRMRSLSLRPTKLWCARP